MAEGAARRQARAPASVAAPPQPRRGLAPATRPRPGTLRASFASAWDGVVETAIRERNLRIHLVAALVVGALGSGAVLAPAERIALLLCAVLVPAAELANSALERLVDLATREADPLARSAKDAAAGAVLVLAAGAVVVAVAVVAQAWPSLLAGRQLLIRQAAIGAGLAAVAVVLLAPLRRPRAVDALLALGGAGLLALLAARTESAASTALSALALGVAVAVAGRRQAAPAVDARRTN